MEMMKMPKEATLEDMRKECRNLQTSPRFEVGIRVGSGPWMICDSGQRFDYC